MGKKKEYKETNRMFLKRLASQEGVFALPGGIYYKVLETGGGTVSPGPRSIVTVHYKGSLIDGRVFDNSYERTCPDALRLSDVIEGWQVALQKMHVGDKWIIYIPYAMGYGIKAVDSIPAYSTLIFEVELLAVA
ncbi:MULTISPECIES: FKBP-type peptidyl-prolyl cis-trans isomerase [Bacteroides]|uniref:FKBP-type peptidyl-prolyl cis-trans isomerase n=1 Tax=Bacteroides TaxID=816 RepID=UPI000468858A|nr:FKBP-type peptidyl-prolyl cis-trans isomerase [Bacteroides acidifaciens]MCR1997757.1 FKBP-type peptidyl-prolyl cis-trans isomerase [Bacteroides acidifaciens]MCR2007432.1 FKBP-type peptidyl-prolyl cis-trans isomerase [Bacteroides acidifaciens]